MRKKRTNYLNNKDILKEIHKSKLSYCYYIDENHATYDIIVNSIDEITEAIVDEARANRAASMSADLYEKQVDLWSNGKLGKTKPKKSDHVVDFNTINKSDVVFRVMTFDHIPTSTSKKNKNGHVKCNFPPFKHYAFVNDELKEVLRSHWKGGFENGAFCLTHGSITNNLANMMMKLCEKYSMKPNWRNYSYLDEMVGYALAQLSSVGLQFNEQKGSNPFAYFTTVTTNSFLRVWNLEKKEQNIRDDILQNEGQMPSFSRQMDDEFKQKTENELEKQQKELKEAGYNF